jgi:hypothetical protein
VVRFLAGNRKFLLSERLYVLSGPSILLFPGHRSSLSLRVKWSGRKADHSSTPYAKIKNRLLNQEQLYLYLTLSDIQTVRTIRNSIVVIPTLLTSNPGRGKGFLSSPKCPDQL